MFTFRIFGLSLIFSLIPAVTALGNQSDPIVSNTQIDEVVVDGARTDIIPTTNTSQTILGEQLPRLGVGHLSEAIRRMAGAEVKDYGGIGGLKTVSVRSLGSKHTTVSYDGIAVNDCQNGQVDIGRFSLDQLSQINITIGEFDDILHPANHFASPSVLSLKTASPNYDDYGGKNFNGVAKLNVGSFGLVNPYASFDHKIGKSNWIKASGNFLRADGDYPYTLTNGGIVTEEKRKNSAVKSGSADLSGRFDLSHRSHLSVKTYYYESDRELPGSVVYYSNLENKETLKDKNAFAQAQLYSDWITTTLLVSGKFNWSGSYYHDEAMKYPGGELDNRYFQREWYCSAVVRHIVNDKFSFSNALDYTYDNFNSNIYDCVFPSRHSLLDALNGKFDNGKVKVTATLLASFFANRAEIGNDPDDEKHLSPAVSVAYNPIPSKLYFRASFKDIFRMPTFNELYFNSFGARTLKPEKSKQFDVGATCVFLSKSSKSTGFQTASVSADAYYNNVTDKIVAIPKMFVWSIVNMGYVDIRGVDCVLHSRWLTSNRSALFFSAKYAFQKAIDITDEKSDIYKHQIPYTPLHSGNGSLAFENPIVNVVYSVTAVGSRYCLPQNIKMNKVDAYTEHGITLYKDVKFKQVETKFRGDILNLTDKQYEVVKFYPMPKRSLRFSVELKF